MSEGTRAPPGNERPPISLLSVVDAGALCRCGHDESHHGDFLPAACEACPLGGCIGFQEECVAHECARDVCATHDCRAVDDIEPPTCLHSRRPIVRPDSGEDEAP